MVTLGIFRSTPAGMLVNDLLGSDGPVAFLFLVMHYCFSVLARVP